VFKVFNSALYKSLWWYEKWCSVCVCACMRACMCVKELNQHWNSWNI
jgi:hypothetical protein